MNTSTKNPAAQALGRLARGAKKTISNAERKRRAESLAEARKGRWEKTKKTLANGGKDE
jgi:hypothetical protein